MSRHAGFRLLSEREIDEMFDRAFAPPAPRRTAPMWLRVTIFLAVCLVIGVAASFHIFPDVSPAVRQAIQQEHGFSGGQK